MDKQTLSNYGWIVVCILVLCVMIALATPFGNFIASSIKSTTQGLFDVEQKAMDAAGLEMAQPEFDTTPNRNSSKYKYYDIVEQGDYQYIFLGNCDSYEEYKTATLTYMMFGADKNQHTYDEALDALAQANFGMSWAEAQAQYPPIYTEMLISALDLTQEAYESAKEGFVNGWNVCAIDKGKTTYQDIPVYVDGFPVVWMSETFYHCTSLTTAPVIPSGVTNMEAAFMGCTSLTVAPVIPSSVTIMDSTFFDCTSLTVAPDMSNATSVTSMYRTFCGCTSLKTYAGNTDADGDFSGYVIPNSVTYMYGAFQECTSLTVAPVIPSSVTNMYFTFQECTSLTTAPVIPSSVTALFGTFAECTSLVVAPVIPNSVTYMYGAFQECTSLTTVPAIPSSVTNMTDTFSGCTALTGTIEINATPKYYDGCFENTQITEILGSCGNKSALLATK